MPDLIIIAGPNGAGKTTAAGWLLPLLKVSNFLNADEVARGLSPFSPETVALEAGKIHLRRIDEMFLKKESFAIETTLSGKTHLKMIEKAKKLDYHVVIAYVFIKIPEVSVQRVAKRVIEGGHNIPTDVIERRFYKGLKNLFDIYIDLADLTYIIDNSEGFSKVIATFKGEVNNGWFLYDGEKFKIMQELAHAKQL